MSVEAKVGQDVLLWREVRTDVLRRLSDRFPELAYEERVLIAEHAAREVADLAHLQRFDPIRHDHADGSAR